MLPMLLVPGTHVVLSRTLFPCSTLIVRVVFPCSTPTLHANYTHDDVKKLLGATVHKRRWYLIEKDPKLNILWTDMTKVAFKRTTKPITSETFPHLDAGGK